VQAIRIFDPAIAYGAKRQFNPFPRAFLIREVFYHAASGRDRLSGDITALLWCQFCSAKISKLSTHRSRETKTLANPADDASPAVQHQWRGTSRLNRSTICTNQLTVTGKK
jgi:hypothetical protein